MQSFSRFAGPGGAREFAEQRAREISQGSQIDALSAAEVRSALAIRDALEHFRRETGRSVSALQAVTEHLAAIRRLGDRPVSEAVAGYLANVVTVKPMDLSAAVAEFLAGRHSKTRAANGKRAQLSPVYAYMTGHFLGHFEAVFRGYPLCDLGREHLDLFFAHKQRAELAPKTRNHYRATIAQFLRWAVRKDYLATGHRLLEASGMEREPLTSGETEFYRPAELRRFLEAADDTLRPIIALCGLAGLRVQEALRLSWSEVFRVPSHVEVTATKSKTRSRRLVEMVPALAAWLEPYRHCEGGLWRVTAPAYIKRATKLRQSLQLSTRRNGLRHAFCTYHFALHGNENLTAQQAGNSPAMIHAHYKGLATKPEAQTWFEVRPELPENLVAFPAQPGL